MTVSADFGGAQAVLAVQGEVDLISAPQLGVFFDAVTASGYPSVVLDLTGLDSIDAAGLTVIVSAASSLVASGGQLTIRSSLSEIAWVLDTSWLAAMISLELTAQNGEGPGAEQGAAASATSLRVALPGATQHMSGVTPMPTSEGVVEGALRLVVALARALVDRADGASVTLRRGGRLSTIAASDQTILAMDSEQYAAGEGPCIDAANVGRWFHTESLETEARWPTFTPKARALGIGAILSSPLLAQDHPVGALNIYSRTEKAFAAHEQELAAVFATEASAILTAASANLTDDQVANRVRRALRMREIIAEAQGIIMEREDIGEKEAFDVMRHSSQKSGEPLSEGARKVVDSTHRNQRGPDTDGQGERSG
jgi:anti-anti-sigma factor